MLRSHSWNVGVLPKQPPPGGMSPALAAAAAMAAARQQQAAAAAQQSHSQLAALRLLNPGGEYPPGASGLAQPMMPGGAADMAGA